MKTTNENFTAKALTLDEMRSVDGGVVGYIVAGLIIAGVGLSLYLEYQDAKNEALTGEYECPCKTNN